MDHTKVDAALQARKKFEDERACWLAAGFALKQAPSPDTFNAALRSNHDRMVRAEVQAVELHREAYGHPTRAGVLFEACENAGVTPPRSPFVDDHDPWEEATIRWVPQHVRKEGAEFVRSARRHAEEDRLFSAEHDLRKLRALVEANQ